MWESYKYTSIVSDWLYISFGFFLFGYFIYTKSSFENILTGTNVNRLLFYTTSIVVGVCIGCYLTMSE